MVFKNKRLNITPDYIKYNLIYNKMKTLTKTRKIGGSLVVTIPKEIVDDINIQENEVVEIEVKKHKKDYFGALKGIGPFTKEDRARGQLD